MVCKELFYYYSYGGIWLKFYIVGSLYKVVYWRGKKKKSEEEIENEKKIIKKKKNEKEEWKRNAIVRR